MQAGTARISKTRLASLSVTDTLAKGKTWLMQHVLIACNVVIILARSYQLRKSAGSPSQSFLEPWPNLIAASTHGSLKLVSLTTMLILLIHMYFGLAA